MTAQPARITPGEVSIVLDRASGLLDSSALADQITFHERKAMLLSLLADRMDTPEAHRVAADAWHYVRTLAGRSDGREAIR